MSAEVAAGLLLLQQEVPANLVGKLPKVTCGDCRKKNCGRHKPSKCRICDGWLGEHMHLDFVGHAETTSKLLEADIEWNWEPMGFTPEGLPAFDDIGGLWIKLTVCGVTRLGYGTADNANGFKAKGDIRKEIIGDALRNAAMRFGWALNLWAKTDIHDRTPQEEPPGEPQHQVADAVVRKAQAERGQMTRSKPAGPTEDAWNGGESTAPPPPGPKMSSRPQQQKIAILIQEKRGPLARPDRLATVVGMVGHALASSVELTAAEAHDLIERLEQEPDYVARAGAPEDAPGQDFTVAPSVGPEGICTDLIAEIEAVADAGELAQVGIRIADLKERGVLHEPHLNRLDAAWRARQERGLPEGDSTPQGGWSHRVLAEQTGVAA